MTPTKTSTQAVLFDLDGTLADTLADIAHSMNHVLKTHGYPEHPLEAYRLFVGRGLKDLSLRVLPESHRNAENQNHIHHALIQEYKAHLVDRTRLYPGIPDLLNKLTEARIPMGILSNKADVLTQQIVRTLMQDWTFAIVVGAGGNIPRKPDPAGALHCAKKMGIAPENIWYVGDSGTDMQTAVAAGMHPVGVRWGFRDREEIEANGARYFLEEPIDLLSVIR